MARCRLALSFAACAALLSGAAFSAEINATVMDTQGSTLGGVNVRDAPSGMAWVRIDLTDIPPGVYAVHFHETGDCSAADFASAGGHVAGDMQHGAMVAGGPHPGDMPNVTAPSDGHVQVEYFVPNLSVEENLMDEDGAAFVMHDGEDDYESQPAGDAGDRMACGAFSSAE
jgi:superoxide dismutase, Cu-Zn family